MEKNNNILIMKGITKYFAGVVALDSVDFELRAGEVHALIGENGAGKSTLMKILLGFYQCDKGEIFLKGNPVHFKSPGEALHHGITMIHQEISLVQEMSVAENIWLGREKQYFGNALSINRKKRLEMTRQLFSRLKIDIDANEIVQNLSVAQMQLIELARAVSYDAEIIIMDEPTSALTNDEVDLLFGIVRDLAKEGRSVVFISHKLEEIYQICDRITVLRDGRFIACDQCENIPEDKLMTMIAGHELSDIYPNIETVKGDVVLSVEGLSSTGTFEDISFCVHAGEVLGISGLMGAGRSEIVRAIYGLDSYTSGHIYIHGKEIKIKSPKQAVRNGIGMVTEDRMRTGAIYALSIQNNAILADLFRIANQFGIISNKKEKDAFKKMTEETSVKFSSANDLIGNLSGGNQQKVLIGRWLTENIKILILDEPTRGIDVGAKSEIYHLIKNLAMRGMAIIMISSELPELLGMSDRIMVINSGRKVYECENKNVTQEELISYAFTS